MDWATIISEILWMEEITEKQLSISLKTRTSPSGINQIKKGVIRSPNFELGMELVQRHKKLTRLYPMQKEYA